MSMENKQICLPLTFRFDQTRTLVTLDEAGNDPFDCFKWNDYPLLFCVSAWSVKDESNSIVGEICKEFGYFLIY